jgi:hypothetical protein
MSIEATAKPKVEVSKPKVDISKPKVEVSKPSTENNKTPNTSSRNVISRQKLLEHGVYFGHKKNR